MLNNKRQNFHHSKLPELGAIVTLDSLRSVSPDYSGKWIVESFNLCDSPNYSYSVGIHLVNLALLRDRDIKRTVSGFYCEAIP
jgi:hypothetical protein